MSKMTGKAVNIHTSGFTFPGQCNGYYWEFPTIKISKRIKTGSTYMTWTIYAGIMEAGTNEDIMKIFANKHVGGKSNPDYVSGFGFKDFAILLRDEYFEHRPISIIGKDLCGFTVVDSHHGDSPQSFGVITKISAGKNLGKKNATNIFTQAMRKALGLYNNRLNEELQLNKNIILPMLASGEGRSVIEMADFIEAKLKTDGKLICQYKYDGIRMMAKIAAPNDALAGIAYPNGLICYSRSGKKIFIAENLQAELLRLLHGKKAILDGELYIHGMHLNDITGYVRREDDCAEKQLLDYYVFDFYAPEATCEARLRSLAKLNMGPYNKIKIVPSVELTSAAAIMDYYNSAINSGHEGLILRRPNAQYEPGDNDHHSKNMIKLKPLIRDEYECVGYNIGTGKAANEIILVCQLDSDNVANAKKYLTKKKIDYENKHFVGKKFSVKFKHMQVSEQKELLAIFQIVAANDRTVFENDYKGRLVTVEFQDYSKTCLPLRPNAISFREEGI